MEQTCQNCQTSFIITADDQAFYDKMKVPAPTWCPSCRAQRRLTWRNERTLYRRKCDAPDHNEMLLTNYSPESGIPIYDQKYWWSDDWDSTDIGREYDFEKPFFTQFKNLLQSAPVPNVINLEVVNSEYCNFTYQSKNCYLNFASDINEDSGYFHHTTHSKSSFDLLGCEKMDSCYESVHCHGCFQSSYLRFSTQCIDSSLLYNCHNCQSCFGSVNLKNAKYMIFNKQYTKEDYEKEIERMQLNTREGFEKARQQFEELILQYPHRFATLLKVENVTGDYLSNAKNCIQCFDMQGPAEDCKYVVYGIQDVRDCRDCHGLGIIEKGYELMGSGDQANNMLFSVLSWVGNDVYYAHYCQGSSNIFGCASLRTKSYCILNKQYTKEEYNDLFPKIIEHMNAMPYKDAQGREYRFGEYFPSEISPFGYNETIAQEFFPLTKEEIDTKGYVWKEPDTKEYNITKKPNELGNTVDDNILNEVIGCEHKGECHEQCSTAFKVIPQEVEFYKRMKLPIPKLCPNCRHYQRLKQRNPLKLWSRNCQCAGAQSENGIYTNTANHAPHPSNLACLNTFETSYAPERKEIVYCEQCYQAETA